MKYGRAMRKVLVTGVNGFAGSHLAKNLHKKGVFISGCGHEASPAEQIKDLCDEYTPCDLTDPAQVAQLPLNEIAAVINLAGIAVNNPNEEDAERVMKTNVLAHTILYDRLAEMDSAARIVCVSSGAIYDPSSSMPLTEESPLLSKEAASAYVRSKILLEEELSKYKDALDIVVARPFNHTGPGQRPGFLVPDWAQRIINNEPLDVSRLDSWRDFTDVRDVVEAYALLALTGRENLHFDVYNISSGVPRLGYDVISLLAKEFGVELPGPRTEGGSIIYASHDRLTSDTGWSPRITIENTIKDFADWRKKQ